MLPDQVEAALVRGVGAYLRSADPNELPPGLKRLRSFRPAALLKVKGEVLSALDREATRALVLQWLDEAKPALSRSDAATLKRAAEAGEGWRESFDAPAPASPDGRGAEAALGRLRDQVEREQARASKAREGERAAKDKLAEANRQAGLRDAAQSRELARLREEVARLGGEVKELQAEAARATGERASDRRRAERALDKEKQDRHEAERALKAARRQLRAIEGELGRVRSEWEAAQGPKPEPAGPPSHEERARARPLRRAPLPAPQGLLEDDPETLSRWLEADRVQLLVDGYNVSKSVTGYGHLSLEDQRKRVVYAVNRLARKHTLKPIVVFDGTETAPGTFRRLQGPALVEYSAGETADDHLIARLGALPPEPVVLVTNDKELRARAASLGATVASSGQLLALAR